MFKLTLGVFLAAAVAAAGILEVGPIVLTGSGTYFDPDWNPDGGEGLPGSLAIALSAFGSNGADSVSIRVGDVGVQFGGTLTVPKNPVFRPYTCFNYAGNSTYPNCQVVIDGISGFGTFTNVGGGAGLAQVFSVAQEQGGTHPGALLAEAQIVSYTNVTSVFYNYPPPQQDVLNRFTATFDLVPPSEQVTNNPEPSTIALSLVGLGAMIGVSRRCSRREENTRR